MAFKPWRQLSKATRARYTAYGRKIGKTGGQVRRDPALRAAARGHATTPTSPAQALRQPERYRPYLQRHPELLRQATPRPADQVAAFERQWQADPGLAPLVFAAPTSEPSHRIKTFTNRDPNDAWEAARRYMAPTQLPRSGMTWIEIHVQPDGTVSYEIWILDNTPGARGKAA